MMEEWKVTRTYSVKYKNKSKMLKDSDAISNTEKVILEDPLVKSVKITDEGQIFSIEVENEDDFPEVMNKVVNVFRKIDDKSEVSYKFGLNRN